VHTFVDLDKLDDADGPVCSDCYWLARKAGIEKRVHPHGLRHTHAYELMMEGVPVPIIQQQLGHSSLATTDRYVGHLAPIDLIARMQEREWDV
jgi:integrase